MANSYFRFKQFNIEQDRCAMKVTTDSCLFGAWVASELKTENEKLKMLDIGAGTGLLSLMIAQKNNLAITAVEIDQSAYEQAAENINASPWKERISLIHGDIKAIALPGQYDIIVSNPPFYENEWQSDNSKKNTAHHSSELLISELVSLTRHHLKASGKFYLLLPYKRYTALMKLFDEQSIFISKMKLVSQSGEHEHFRLMIEACFKEEGNTVTTEISIRDKNNEYTKEFTALLKDYYLYL